MFENTGFKASQIFGWETEPKTERTSVARPSEAAAGLGQAHARRPAADTGWKARREAPSGRDQSLSLLAKVWLQQFLPSDSPHQLCGLYPRVANRLALCWPDSALTLQLLESLLVDKRGKRQGFPIAVADELMRLRRIRETAAAQ